MSFLDGPTPLAFAHRGGALLPANDGIENTLTAFRNAVELGYRYLETDVHTSRDGVVYAFHDVELTRMTGTVSAFRDLGSAGIDAILVGGREPIPRLADLLHAFPDARFNIDVKADDAIEPTLAVLRDADARLEGGAVRLSNVRHLRFSSAYCAENECRTCILSPQKLRAKLARRFVDGLCGFLADSGRRGTR